MSQRHMGENCSLDVNGIQWDVLEGKARQLGIEQLVYKALSEWCAHRGENALTGESIATPFLACVRSLRRKYVKTTLENEVILEQLDTIVQEAHRADIDIIILKGAYLLRSVYDDLGLRAMSDIDVLVRQDDVDKTEALLKDLGYGYLEGCTRQDYIDHLHLPPLGHPNHKTIVEVHHDITPPNTRVRMDLDSLWRRAEPITINQAVALSLSLEETLIHVSLHSVYQDKLQFQGLRQTIDIAFILARHGKRMNWEFVRELAVRHKITAYLFVSLYMSNVICKVEVPREVLTDLRPLDLEDNVLSEAVNRILQRKLRSPISQNMIGLWKEGVSQPAIARIGHLFSREALSKMYSFDPGSWMIYCFVPDRLFRLMWRYGRSMMTLIAGDADMHECMLRRSSLDDWLQ